MKGNTQQNVNSLWCLRLLFACLTVGCLMQIAHDAAETMPGCSPIYYVADGDGSSHLRQHDPDAPLIGTKRQSQEAPATEAKPKRSVPKMVVAPLYKAEQEKIDNGINDTARCAQYGVPVLPEDEKHAKRIFFGSMLANENPEVLDAHAIEVHNKYDVIALVESNTTHSGDPRDMLYESGSTNARLLQESGIFGSKTKVVIDYWLEDLPFLYDMDREVEQRNAIWKIWLEQGMTQRDIGIMADLDEIVSRDFLNALQVCDFPKLRYNPDERPDCQAPKMVLAAIQFDGSPLCIKKYEWFHPDVILGNCIAGVGDPSGRTTPQREYSPPGSTAKTLGQRDYGWGYADYNKYPQDVIDNKRFPLWDGRDIREISGSADDLTNFVEKRKMGHGKTAVFGASYHLHNWFKDTKVLRHKFLTYGHSDQHAMEIPLSNYTDGDVNMMVRCARGLGNQIKVQEEDYLGRYEYYENNHLMPQDKEQMFSLGGNRPIYFKNWTYVKERHALVQQMILDDEAKYGTIYKD